MAHNIIMESSNGILKNDLMIRDVSIAQLDDGGQYVKRTANKTHLTIVQDQLTAEYTDSKQKSVIDRDGAVPEVIGSTQLQEL